MARRENSTLSFVSLKENSFGPVSIHTFFAYMVYIHTYIHLFQFYCMCIYYYVHYIHTLSILVRYIRVCYHSYLHTYIHTNKHTYIHTNKQRSILPYPILQEVTFIPCQRAAKKCPDIINSTVFCIHTYIHTYTNSSIHTYLHTYIHTCFMEGHHSCHSQCGSDYREISYIHTYIHTYIQYIDMQASPKTFIYNKWSYIIYMYVWVI